MEFCDDCGSLMKTEGDVWVCGSCGHEQARDSASEKERAVTTQDQQDTDIVDMSEAKEQARPTTRAQCPNCDNDQAYYYMQQIRAADESETRFFVCTECDHKWREDDH